MAFLIKIIIFQGPYSEGRLKFTVIIYAELELWTPAQSSVLITKVGIPEGGIKNSKECQPCSPPPSPVYEHSTKYWVIPHSLSHFAVTSLILERSS